MGEALKDYHPTGKGRPPTDPKKLKLWKAANKALHEKNEGEAKPAEPKSEKRAAPKKKKATKKAAATVHPIKRQGATKAATHAAQRKPRGLARAFVAQPEQGKGLDNDPRLLPENNLHDIIALCRREGIAHLKLNGIEITFHAAPTASTGPKDQEKSVPVEGAPVPEAQVPSSVSALTSADMLDDLEETQNLIDNPLAFEEAEIDRHLNHGASGAELQAGRAESNLRGSGISG